MLGWIITRKPTSTLLEDKEENKARRAQNVYYSIQQKDEDVMCRQDQEHKA